jgi:hypothetical protein
MKEVVTAENDWEWIGGTPGQTIGGTEGRASEERKQEAESRKQ